MFAFICILLGPFWTFWDQASLCKPVYHQLTTFPALVAIGHRKIPFVVTVVVNLLLWWWFYFILKKKKSSFVRVQLCNSTSQEVRGQLLELSGVRSLFPFCGIKESNPVIRPEEKGLYPMSRCDSPLVLLSFLSTCLCLWLSFLFLGSNARDKLTERKKGFLWLLLSECSVSGCLAVFLEFWQDRTS